MIIEKLDQETLDKIGDLPPARDMRLQSMVDDWMNLKTLHQIAEAQNPPITRERVRQLLNEVVTPEQRAEREARLAAQKQERESAGETDRQRRAKERQKRIAERNARYDAAIKEYQEHKLTIEQIAVKHEIDLSDMYRRMRDLGIPRSRGQNPHFVPGARPPRSPGPLPAWVEAVKNGEQHWMKQDISDSGMANRMKYWANRAGITMKSKAEERRGMKGRLIWKV